MNREQEFCRGWNLAAQQDYSGIKVVPLGVDAEFIKGYNGFWDKQALELEAAEQECEADYDNGAGYYA